MNTTPLQKKKKKKVKKTKDCGVVWGKEREGVWVEEKQNKDFCTKPFISYFMFCPLPTPNHLYL